MAPPDRPALERRAALDAEVRALAVDADPADTRRISGMACVTGIETELGPGIFETIEPSAFAKVDDPQSRDVKLLLSHSAGAPLASKKAGTLGLRLLPQGLSFTATLADTQLGRDTFETVRRGDLNGASIGFRVRPDGIRWETRGPDRAVRIISSLDLFEISVTGLPAQQETYVEARILDEGRAQLEALAREARATQMAPALRDAQARLALASARAALAEASATERDLLAPRRRWQGPTIG